MKKNLDTFGRILRFLIACIVLFFAYERGSFLLLFLSLFVFYEAFASWCLFYQLIGKNSCPRE